VNFFHRTATDRRRQQPARLELGRSRLLHARDQLS
jgi:hypothetical protein